MKPYAHWFCAVCLSLLVSWPARADLEGDIRAVLRDRALQRAEVGIEIVCLAADAKKDAIVFRHNSEIPLVPASNLKLVTTSTALATLGADFKFRTLLLKHNNDLVLIGDGDPSLGDWELLKKSGWNVTTVFQNWARELAKSGFKSFDRVVVDDSIFDEQFAHPSWPADQAHKRYVAQVGGINLNANCVDFTIRAVGAGEVVQYSANPPTRYITVANTCLGASQSAVWLSRMPGQNHIILKGHSPSTGESPVSVTIHDPPLFAATVLAETLGAAGVRIAAEKPVRDRTLRSALLKTGIDKDPSWSVLAIHETPLAAVLARANKDSVNLYADALAKRTAAEATGQSGSWKASTEAAAGHLAKIGIPPEQFRLVDGCGLARENTVSAHALCQVLAWNYRAPTRDVYLASLAISGRDGTLEHRFTGSMNDLRGRVLGKSGFINSVRTLSGYLKAKDGNWYAFSILMNQMGDTATGKNLQEQIVRAIDVHTKELASGRE